MGEHSSSWGRAAEGDKMAAPVRQGFPENWVSQILTFFSVPEH